MAAFLQSTIFYRLAIENQCKNTDAKFLHSVDFLFN